MGQGVAVGRRSQQLSRDEIARAFAGPDGDRWGPILSRSEFGRLIGISPKTLSEWIGKGRLDGAFRRRGKHTLIWRDRAIDILFNGADWS
jgi:hypothetical protein